jgi:hypothetical protein
VASAYEHWYDLDREEVMNLIRGRAPSETK